MSTAAAPSSSPSLPDGAARRILVAYDGSAPSHAALLKAAELARPGDPVYVIGVMDYPAADRAVEERTSHAKLLEAARETLAEAGVAAATVAAEGDTATEILAAARETHATLLVLAIDRARSHQRGFVTADIVRHAGCDVYVIYAPEDKLGTRATSDRR